MSQQKEPPQQSARCLTPVRPAWLTANRRSLTAVTLFNRFQAVSTPWCENPFSHPPPRGILSRVALAGPSSQPEFQLVSGNFNFGREETASPRRQPSTAYG
jgi:hypothetical protein